MKTKLSFHCDKCFVQAESHLLQPLRIQDRNKKCVVIDLDETLVHSSFTVSYSPCLVLGL